MKLRSIVLLLIVTTSLHAQQETPAMLKEGGLNVTGIDQFGRTFNVLSNYKEKKQVGIFYWPWIGQPYATGVYDATKISAMPGGLKLLYDFKSLDTVISPNRQAHFWGEPIWGYYNSEDDWVIRRQMNLLTIAGIDFIVFDLTNRKTYKNVYERVFRVIEDFQHRGWKPPKVVFYTHSRSMETTRDLFENLYKPNLFSNAWYKVGGKPMIIAYTKTEDDMLEAKSRNDNNYNAVPYPKEILDFFYFKKPQWPFDPVYPDGFPWVEWSFPQPLHGGIMSVTVASHPKVPMSRSITSGWINWGRGWNPDRKENISAEVDRGTFFQRQWDHAIEVNPDTVFVGGWNEWVAYKQPYGDEYMLCDAANKEYSRDIEPMRGGYEDAFYLQLIKNIRRYKGVEKTGTDNKSISIDINGNIAQWAQVKTSYQNIEGGAMARNNYGVSKKIFYQQPAATNQLVEVKVAHDSKYFYFFIKAEKDFVKVPTAVSALSLYIGRGTPSLKGWKGYEFAVKENRQSATFDLCKLDSSAKCSKLGPVYFSLNHNILQLRLSRKQLAIRDEMSQIYFKVTDGITHPEDIMDTYLSGSALPMGRLSYSYQFAAKEDGLEIKSLTIEGRDTILGSDILQPRLSWKINSTKRNLIQTAYRILVASSGENLKKGIGDLWDSKSVASGQSLNILYKGKPLTSYQSCYWKVQVWTNAGDHTWSEPGYWSMGLLNNDDWKAKWIGQESFNEYDQPDSTYTRLAAKYLRKEFTVGKTIKSATAFISGMGLYEFYLNGQKVGIDVLAPAVSEYNKKIFYNTYDVKALLQNGRNCAGILLGNGRYFGMRNYHGKPDPLTGIAQRSYGLPRALLQIRLVYTDGTVDYFTTNESWKVTSRGPIIANNEFDGEEYDARKELIRWASVGYNDATWKPVNIMPAATGKIVSQLNENIRIKEILHPVSIEGTSRGTYLVDVGQNMAGWLAIRLRAEKGDTIKLRFAETRKAKDSIYTDNLRNAHATDIYIAKGEGTEQWEPRFTYHGFRYVEIYGLQKAPSVEDLDAKVIYDNVQTIGSFTTSNETINQVFKNAYWTIRSNYRSMPTDCPQRDERVGWLGDRVISSYGESFLFDNSRLYAKWMDDIRDAQKENGSLPDIAPSFWDRYADNVTYPSAFILIPEMLRRQFGDSLSLAKEYPAMKKWMIYMWDTYRENDLVLKDNYGDWCVPPESLDLIWSKDPNRTTDGGLLASAYYYYCLKLLKQYALTLQENQDAKLFDSIAKKVYAAFNSKYYNRLKKSYANNTVTANLLPLSFGLAPKGDEASIFKNIRNRLTEFDDHVNSGIIGGMWLMRGLTDNGAADLAYKLATNTTYPSWGYMVKKGATTIWELWNGDAANPMMNSGNHQMLLGDLLVWYYEYLAGIKSDLVQTAFKKVIMHPIFPEGLQFVDASLETKYGFVKSNWKKTVGGLEWEIVIPPNASVDVQFPTVNARSITENGKSFVPKAGEQYKPGDTGTLRLILGSGTYHFLIKQ